MPALPKAAQSIPKLFKLIIMADDAKDDLLTQKVVPFFPAIKLIRDRRDMSRRAEEMLNWNANKGKR